nr:YjcZ family sporulation protein [Peribacillus alkalitolerans]
MENAQLVLGANIPHPPTQVLPTQVQPSYYPPPAFCYADSVNRCDDFVLIVVLFILLIIVGATLCFC